ncbi:hypothetical protein [Phormidium sp. FACHB-1136]|uniref:hypothetical protein n=1 Tax=Phormidium sp. FACHB-1136 TaxID=2692848 RepID=UPI00168649F7|nr:hypothetical protein [Phormidium sp. FACHB-1136]MBD2427462.1 hypothetical protein [Phormidium sp. FACHB-1136]
MFVSSRVSSDQPPVSPSPVRPRPGSASMAVFTTHLLVGSLVPPVLLGLIAARIVADGFRQAGLVGEQLLQGQRLPHLHVHPQD